MSHARLFCCVAHKSAHVQYHFEQVHVTTIAAAMGTPASFVCECVGKCVGRGSHFYCRQTKVTRTACTFMLCLCSSAINYDLFPEFDCGVCSTRPRKG